jgi:tetratricopeptide (TPR) repeat protein
MDGRLHARRTLFLLAFLVSCIPSLAQVSRQVDEEAGELFARGVAEYQSGEFGKAAETFGAIATSYPGSQRITAALIMRGKALYWAGENLASARAARSVLTDYPRSQYAADAHLLLGNIYRRIERHDEAMGEIVHAWESMGSPEPPRLAQEIVTAMDTLASASLTTTQLRRFIAISTNRECQAFLWLKIAEKEAATENTLRLKLALDTLLQLHPSERSHPRVAALLNRLSRQSDVKLAALLPLMQKGEPTAAREIAHDVYDGIRHAVQQFMADPDRNISVSLLARDTERDPVTAAGAVRELAADENVLAIIGPVFSSSAVAAARAAEESGVPLITPTANANGIAGTGGYVFQANPDYQMRGRAMAQYAVVRRKFMRVAILAPSDSYGKFLAEAFGEEARRLGAHVLATEWYERGVSDLKQQLGAIRRAGLRAGADPLISFGGKKKLGELMKLAGLGVPVRKLDSLMHRGATVSAIALVGPDAVKKLDSLGIAVVYNDVKADSLDTPVTTIDALYMPISAPSEIGVVSSQVVYFNLQTQMLGSGEWDNLAELDANRRYCSGVLFETDSYPDTSVVSYRQWLAGFQTKFRKLPSRHTLYGYDTAELLLQTIRGGATTRQAFIRALAEVRNYQSLHAKVGFSPGRVNTWLGILQFDGRNVLRVDEIQAE